MKKGWILFLAAGLVLACNNDTTGKGKEKSAMDNREKDDYRKTGADEGNRVTDNKNTSEGNNTKTTATDQSHDGWGDSKNTTEWTEADKNRFMEECERTAGKKVSAARANEYCDCMLQKLMKLYPTYDQANRELDKPGMEDKMDAMVAECNNH